MKPSLTHSVKTTGGEVVESFEPEVIRQVISEETSARMRELLENVVSEGSGSRAYVAGYRVGGKTGTAQKYAEDGSVKQNVHLSSFIGFAPANDPEIAVFFIIDEATETYSDYGSIIAAPYVGQIIEESMKYLNVEPQYTQEEIEKQGGLVETPDVVGMTLNEAKKKLNSVGLKYTLIGSEEGVVYEQMPAPGVKLTKGTSIVLNIKPKEEIEPPEIVEVPNLIGKTISECRDILEELGLELYSHGSGKAIWQSPKPNNEVETGTTIRVEFSDE
jgi:stage V sporulation protein D (sporulation-specific penicillin-binding protein)